MKYHLILETSDGFIKELPEIKFDTPNPPYTYTTRKYALLKPMSFIVRREEPLPIDIVFTKAYQFTALGTNFVIYKEVLNACVL